MSDPLIEDRVAIVDVADDLQVRKQRIFKILPRLGIRPTQRREQTRGNQNVATVTRAEANAIRDEIERSGATPPVSGSRLGGPPLLYSDDLGYFYLLQLEPEHDPGRFKVGFTTDLDGRLQKHRCAAPFAQYRGSWPCRRVWERAAIDCAANGCAQLHTEVFRAAALDEVASRARSFFGMMPKLEADPDDSGDDPTAATTNEAG